MEQERTQMDIATAEATGVMQTDIKYLVKTLDELKASLEKNYVQKNEFAPVQKITYGLVSVVLIGTLTFIGSQITLITKAFNIGN